MVRFFRRPQRPPSEIEVNLFLVSFFSFLGFCGTVCMFLTVPRSLTRIFDYTYPFLLLFFRSLAKDGCRAARSCLCEPPINKSRFAAALQSRLP
jgi:hypothetical protein